LPPLPASFPPLAQNAPAVVPTSPGLAVPQPVGPVVPVPVAVDTRPASPAAVTPVSPAQVPVPLPAGGAVVPTPPVPFPPEPEGPRVVEPANVPPVPSRPPADPAAGPVAGPTLREVASARVEVRVFVGGSKLLELGADRRITRVLVDNPRIADIQLLDQEAENPRLINLYGISFGRATLTVWDENGAATSYTVVVGLDEAGIQERLRAAIPGADVTVRQLAAQIILEGQVPDARTMDQVLNLVVSELRLNVATAGSNVVMANAPMGNVGAQQAAAFGGVGGGGQGGGGQGGGASAASDPGAGVIINRVRVPGPRQVLLRVKIAELNRTALRQLGVSWLDTRNNSIIGSTIGGAGSIGASSGVSQAASFSPMSLLPGAINSPIPGRIQSPGFSPVASAFNAGANAATNASSQLFGIFNAGEFNLFINALRGNGLAKILAEPNVVALDGQPASFQAGGEFPYPVPQAATAGGGSVITIEFARFGAILDFLPQVMENDVIRLDVSPTFSELNFSAGFAIPGAGTVPGINSRTARTVVEMREGQTLAIAGLLSTRTTGATSRIPILGDLPIVGPWFSANRIETVETELVVLVTPELVAPVDAHEMPPGPGEMLLEPNDYEFFFLGRLEGKTGHPHRATVQYLDPLEVMKHVRSEAHWVVGPHGHAD
jgi:pilus assembly protein CpaC